MSYTVTWSYGSSFDHKVDAVNGRQSSSYIRFAKAAHVCVTVGAPRERDFPEKRTILSSGAELAQH